MINIYLTHYYNRYSYIITGYYWYMTKIEKVKIFRRTSKGYSFAISYPVTMREDSGNVLDMNDDLVMELVPEGLLIRKA